jgi:GxxExxY protein
MRTDPAGINSITERVIGCAIKVHRILGPGLLESAYAPCLALELRECGLQIEQKKAVPLIYRGIVLDVCYWLDMVVNDLVVVELKSVEQLAPVHNAQLLTYLRLTGRPVGLLMNFNCRVLKDGIKRIINREAFIK